MIQLDFKDVNRLLATIQKGGVEWSYETAAETIKGFMLVNNCTSEEAIRLLIEGVESDIRNGN